MAERRLISAVVAEKGNNLTGVNQSTDHIRENKTYN